MNTPRSYQERLPLYQELVSDFVSEKVSAGDFERRYLSAFKEEKSQFPTATFEVLDDLFSDVDAYCPDAAIRSMDGIDEMELRRRAQDALQRLSAVSDSGPK